MISILLSDKGSTPAQEWWWQFIRSVDKKSQASTTDDHIDVVNLELLNWSAHLWQHQPTGADWPLARKNAYIDFYDEQAYTWFVLRWT